MYNTFFYIDYGYINKTCPYIHRKAYKFTYKRNINPQIPVGWRERENSSTLTKVRPKRKVEGWLIGLHPYVFSSLLIQDFSFSFLLP